QHLHVVLRGGSVLGEDLGDLLGLLPEILGYLMDTILFKTQIKPPPSRPGREPAQAACLLFSLRTGGPIRRLTFVSPCPCGGNASGHGASSPGGPFGTRPPRRGRRPGDRPGPDASPPRRQTPRR